MGISDPASHSMKVNLIINLANCPNNDEDRQSDETNLQYVKERHKQE
jgi:hypothetical protein